MASRKRRNHDGQRYWHAGWSGRPVGDLLLPIARQESFYAKSIRGLLHE